MQEGMAAIIVASRSYEERRGAKRSTYYTVCARNKMINYIRKQKTLYYPNGENDFIPTDLNMDERIIEKQDILGNIYKLTEQELQVFMDCFISSMDRKQIAKKYSISKQRVSIIIRKITEKLLDRSF